MKFITNYSSLFNKSSRRGFTLIELLIVIAIIAILTGIIITSLTASKAKARDAQRVSDLNQIQLALEQYFDRCGAYPPADTNGGGGPLSIASCTNGGTTVKFSPDYITAIPKDPSTRLSYGYAVNTPNTDYVLYTTLESGNNAQANSFSETVRSSSNYSSWATNFNCYDANTYQKQYCVSTK